MMLWAHCPPRFADAATAKFANGTEPCSSVFVFRYAVAAVEVKRGRC